MSARFNGEVTAKLFNQVSKTAQTIKQWFELLVKN